MTSASQGGEPISLIKTKLCRPRVGADLIPRPHLLERLNYGLDRKFALISAPAGYGKTTLLCQWLKDCPQTSAWLTLDEGDNDLAVFLSYLIAAVRTVFPNACPTTWELLRAPDTPPVDYLATTLINELAEIPKPLILALDDYHTIRSRAVRELLDKVLQYLPDRVHLAIASRIEPSLALVRLRAGRQVVELRAEDLSFSVEEAGAYLESELGRVLPLEVVTLLEQRTEGWIVGLHLAALWLHEVDDYTVLLDGFQGNTNQFVREYLASEVLTLQPAEVQQFLLWTSMLDRFCVPLCDAVCFSGAKTASGSTGTAVLDEGSQSLVFHPSSSAAGPLSRSQEILTELARANLFLVPLDEQGNWYRYHHLFQEILQLRLRSQSSPDEVAAAHRRASQWFAHHGYTEEALQHALAANDVDAAVELVENECHNLLNRFERHTLERWLALLPEEVVWERPQLLVAQAWLLYRQWRLGALDAILDRVKALLDATDEKQFLSGHVCALASVTASLVHNDAHRSLTLAERALQELPPAERGARGVALVFLALAQQATGHKESGVWMLQEAIDDPTPLGPDKIQPFIGLCLVHLLAGDLHLLHQATQQFLAFAVNRKNIHATAGVNWTSGLLHYEWNNLDAAAEHFSRMAELRRRTQVVAVFSSVLGLARIWQVRGELEVAQELIDDLRAESMRLNNTEFLPALDAYQAYLWLLQGDASSALGWARSFDPRQLVEPFIWPDVPSLRRARILVAAGTESDVRTTVNDLQAKLAEAEVRHFTQRVIQILAHLALAFDRLGQGVHALDALQRGIALAQPGGFIRSFVDCGPTLKPLLQQLRGRGIATEYVSTLLAAFAVDRQPPAADGRASAASNGGRRPELRPTPLEEVSDHIEPLTRREEEILRLIGHGLTNQEIADELVISPHTVKTHATNIYRKLAVDSRRHAIRKARQLGILPSN